MVTTLLKVERIGRQKVFCLRNKLRFDKFSTYDVLPSTHGQDTVIQMILTRGGEPLDEGRVAFMGGHSADYYFFGFPKTRPKELADEYPQGPIASFTFDARWFRVGDVLMLSTSSVALRRNIVGNYYSQLRKSRRYKKDVDQARKHLNERVVQQSKVPDSDKIRQRRMVGEIYRMANAKIRTRLAKEKLPPVIKWRSFLS